MKYRVKDGVVLLTMFGKPYLFPSRRSGIALPFLITLTDRLASLLKDGPDSLANGASLQGCMQNDEAIILSGEEESKIRRLIKLNYIEEVRE